MAQGVPQAEKKPDSLGPVVVTSPQRKPLRRTESGTQRSHTPARVAGRPRTGTAVPVAAPVAGGGFPEPLSIPRSPMLATTGRLTVPAIPATVEVIDKQTIGIVVSDDQHVAQAASA